MNRKRNQKVRGRKTLRQKTSNLNPPQILTNVVKSHRYRYLASSAIVAVGIQDVHVQRALGGICTVANTTVAVSVKSFKLNKIEIWAPTSTSTTPTTVSVEWLGQNNSPNLEHSDTSINVSRPAHLITRPPRNSLASFWQNSAGGTALFVLNCPSGSIIDISVNMIEADESTALLTSTIVTGTLGVQYWLPLDGTTTHLLTPVSLNTTF